MVKVNKQKNSDTENLIYNQYRERVTILNTENIKISARVTKLEAIKNAIYLRVFFHICSKFDFF